MASAVATKHEKNQAKRKAIGIARRYAYTRPLARGLTLEEAKSCSDIAYDGKEGGVTKDKKWIIPKGGVFASSITGFRAVLLRPNTARESRTILSFKGTDSSFHSVGSTLDVFLDAGTD